MANARHLAVAVVVAASLTPAPVAAAAGIPVARATLRVAGSGAAFSRVHLTRPMSPVDAPTVRALGDTGRIAVLFVQDVAKDPRLMIVDRMPASAGGAWAVTTYGVRGSGGATVLPAGRYRVYLVASRPTTVTLRLAGQPAGTTPLAPRARVKYRVSELPAERIAGQFRPVSQTYDSFTFARPGLGLTVGILDYDAMHSYSIGGCVYDGPPPAAERHLQICAGGRSIGAGGGYVVPSATRGRVTGGLVVWPFQPGTATLGLQYKFVGVLTNVRQYNLWLEF